MKSQLTMHNKPPFILNCTIGNEWILRAACQILSIVINNRDECEHAQCLIAGFRKLLMRGKKSKNLRFKFLRKFYIFGHAFDLSRALPPCQHRFWTRSGALTFDIVALLGRHKLLSGCDVNGYWLHCKFASWGSQSGKNKKKRKWKFEFCCNEWKFSFLLSFALLLLLLESASRPCMRNFLNEKLCKFPNKEIYSFEESWRGF